MRILILGGTAEARALAGRLKAMPGLAATLSLAGRTRDPAPQPLPVRIGGFGGPEGLAAYLERESIDLLVDATHPFAERITENAVAAARATGRPLLVLRRPPWTPVPGDRWTEVADLAAAVAALGPRPRRVFITTGRLGLAAYAAAPWHHYLVRSIDPVDDVGLPEIEVILDRPPHDRAAEEALMRDKAIDVVVTKNAGSPATYGKIEAARALGLEVVVIRQPALPGAEVVADVDAAQAVITAHLAAHEAGLSTRRGV